MIPQIVHNGGVAQLMADGKPFLILGGEVHNSSSSSLAYMAPVWPRLKNLGLNTVLLPLTWELTEPEEGEYDFTLPDGLIEGARQHGLKVVFLWFGVWKNAISSYVPPYVKTDTRRFFRVQSDGGGPTGAISCLCDACLEAETRVVGALLGHLREADTERTVLAIQVENEAGILGDARDYGREAEALFGVPIPGPLAAHLAENRAGLAPELLDAMDFSVLSGSWRQVFGPLAEEAFMAYHTARYVGRIAEAGKAAYSLPMVVNAWPDQCPKEPAGMHPSGGPVARMHDIWRFAAPALDALGVDLYLENFAEECAAYRRLAGNPLFIPEARGDKWLMAHAFYAYAQQDALCFSPFGAEDIGVVPPTIPGIQMQGIFQSFESLDTSDLLRRTYGVLGNLSELICRFRGTGKMHAVLQARQMFQVVRLARYYARVTYTRYLDEAPIPAGGLFIELGENEFIVAGGGFRVEFCPRPGYPRQVEYLLHDEGEFVEDRWVRGRRLNGDERHLALPELPVIRRLRLHNY